MNALTWVVLGVAIYWIGLLLLRNRGYLPDYVGLQGPLITVHTKRGRELLAKLAGPRRFWRAVSNIGVGVTLVVMVVSFLFVVSAAISSVRSPVETSITQPRNVLVIPGVNEFLPLSVAPEIVFGLLVGLVVHEGAHGLLCRVEDIDIESMGVVLLAVIPIGAFVEPDQESQRRADRGGRTRMFAAGVTANFAVTIVAFALLFGPVIGAIGVAPGAPVGGVFPGSAADDAGIEQGDRITAIDDHPIAATEELQEVLRELDEETVTVTIDGERSVTVQRSIQVVQSVPDGPAAIPSGTSITAVNGTPVSTVAEFEGEIEERAIIRIETNEGERVFPAGALVPAIQAEGPASEAGMPTGTPLVITHLDDRRIISTESLTETLRSTDPGDRVEVRAVIDGEIRRYEVRLGEHPDGYGFLGILTIPGTTGIVANDFGTREYPASTYLGLLGGDGDDGEGALVPIDSFLSRIFVTLLLPVAGVLNAGIPYNFAGFTGHVTNFYVVEGPLSILGGGVFLLANALFWTGWINLNLAFFNCIPAFPLDGGHVLRMSAEAVLSRLPFELPPESTKTITITVGVTMLVSLLLMIFGQGLLA